MFAAQWELVVHHRSHISLQQKNHFLIRFNIRLYQEVEISWFLGRLVVSRGDIEPELS